MSDVILVFPAVNTFDTPYFHNNVWLPKLRTTQVNKAFVFEAATWGTCKLSCNDGGKFAPGKKYKINKYKVKETKIA